MLEKAGVTQDQISATLAVLENAGATPDQINAIHAIVDMLKKARESTAKYRDRTLPSRLSLFNPKRILMSAPEPWAECRGKSLGDCGCGLSDSQKKACPFPFRCLPDTPIPNNNMDWSDPESKWTNAPYPTTPDWTGKCQIIHRQMNEIELKYSLPKHCDYECRLAYSSDKICGLDWSQGFKKLYCNDSNPSCMRSRLQMKIERFGPKVHRKETLEMNLETFHRKSLDQLKQFCVFSEMKDLPICDQTRSQKTKEIAGRKMTQDPNNTVVDLDFKKMYYFLRGLEVHVKYMEDQTYELTNRLKGFKEHFG